VKALDVCPPTQGLGNLLPVFAPVDSDSLGELLVLNLGPMPLDFDVVALMVLGRLILGWPSLVKMRIEHLMPDELLLSFAVSQIIQVVGHFQFLIF
jgi:hypothetical protein